MAATRYGYVEHEVGEYFAKNYIKFASKAERDAFKKEFDKYHASHDHDGPAPLFFETQASGILQSDRCIEYNRDEMTIDGYTIEEIRDYHEDNRRIHYFQKYYDEPRCYYQPPTCCVSPIIVIDNKFVDSGKLKRHDLSSIFGDVAPADLDTLKKSVDDVGFTDNLIRIYEGKILDGWHRYSVAKDLNLVRKLRFTEWDTEKEGSPQDFVLARNIERRHLSPGQRAQIVVHFSDMAGRGRPKNVPNGTFKSRSELAKEAGVGETTISRAKQVEELGESEAVIAGEKSATEVIQESKSQAERDAEKKQKVIKQQLKNMWDWRQEATNTYTNEEFLSNNFTLDELKHAFAWYEQHDWLRDEFLSALQRTSRATLAIVVSDTLETDVKVEQLEQEARAMRTFMVDLTRHDREAWIQDLLTDKQTEAEQETKENPETEPTEDEEAADEEKRTFAELLAANREKAQAAEVEMWKVFEASELSKYMDKDDFCEEIAKNIQCPAEFPNPMEMEKPGHWLVRFEGVRRTLEMESGWVKELLDGFRTDIEKGDADPVEEQDTEHDPQTSEQMDDTKPEPEHLIKFISIGFDYPNKYKGDNVLCFENNEDDGDFALTEIPEEIILRLWDVIKKVELTEDETTT